MLNPDLQQPFNICRNQHFSWLNPLALDGKSPFFMGFDHGVP
jgi:hypothetical protein